MPLVVDNTYPAKATRPRLTTSENGSDGLFIHFDCGENGGIDHTIWLTAARIEYSEKDLNNLGIPSDQLRSEDFWEKITEWVDGKECEIVVGEEEYKGKKRLRVKFINAIAKAATPGASKRLASLFGGGSAGYAPDGEPSDDEAAKYARTSTRW
jgi:hypothetical protein